MTVHGGAGKDVFIASISPGALPMIFDGGAGDDSFRFTSSALQGETVKGGDGTDEVVLVTGGTVVDSNFSNVHDAEVLRLAAAKGFYVTLESSAEAAGLFTVDAALAGVDINVSALAYHTGVTFIASAKSSRFTGGDKDDTFVFDAKTLKGDDAVHGGKSDHGDMLKFSTGGIVAATAFDNVDGIEGLILSDAGNAVTLSDHLIAGARIIWA